MTTPIMDQQTEIPRKRSIPYFALREDSGLYHAKRDLSPDQIVKAAMKVIKERVSRGRKFDSTSKSMEYLVLKLAMEEREVFYCLFLDAQHQIISEEPLFWGTVISGF